MIDLGTGNNNKVNWAFNDKQELIDIIEVVYRCGSCVANCISHRSSLSLRSGGRKGRGLVISPKDYSTKYKY
jgi:DIM1 family U5 snRNP protein